MAHKIFLVMYRYRSPWDDDAGSWCPLFCERSASAALASIGRLKSGTSCYHEYKFVELDLYE